MSEADGRGEHRVLFEFTRVGSQYRVAAIDSDSGVEAIIIAPATASQVQMQKIALAKLKRMLEKHGSDS